MPDDIAWRALFIVGILPASLVIYLRRNVAEPEVFVKHRQSRARGTSASPFSAIFKPGLLRTTIFASLLASGIQGAYYSVLTWLPTYLKATRNLTALNTGGYLLILIFGSFLGYLAGAFLMDHIGRRRTFVVFALLSAVTSYIYFAGNLPDAVIMFAGFPLGFAVSGMVGGFGAFLSELFPTSVRATGQGFSYNVGRVVAASFPPLIGLLSGTYSLPSVMAAFALSSFACVIFAALALPETKGRKLDSVHADSHAEGDPLSGVAERAKAPH
ncbi:putative sialic acid transporter [compost metagenome]